MAKEMNMASINKVLLLGNLGRNPELRTTLNGKPVMVFPMATSRRWKDRRSGEDRSLTDWHRVIVWGHQAEVLAEYLKKGSQVHIEGRLLTRNWTDGEGVKRYVTEVVASRVQMLGRPEDQKAPKPVVEPEAPSGPPDTDGTEDDIPF
jgi:single-strand DNA-binding protein